MSILDQPTIGSLSQRILCTFRSRTTLTTIMTSVVDAGQGLKHERQVLY